MTCLACKCSPKRTCFAERALHQSREATALKLVDAVDLQGNVREHSEGLPHVINQFCAFLLEQLSKESREAAKEQQRMQIERAERARKLAAKHERVLLVGALPVGGAAEHERNTQWKKLCTWDDVNHHTCD